MSLGPDRRVLFFGDSFVAGLGDRAGLGWVGRVVAASFEAGLPLTAYNLGVRRETSVQVAARWQAEARPRMVTEACYGAVFGFGTNDMTEEGGRLRVAPGLALQTFGEVLEQAAASDLRAFAVGPPPAGEAAQDERIRELSRAFGERAAQHGVPYVGTVEALRADAAWTAEAAAGDGVHPRAGGYAALARLVLAGAWTDWLSEFPSTGAG